MEILEQPTRDWVYQLTCDRCKTKIRVNQDDLQLEGFKVSGYHFTGTAVIEDKFFVECPTDGHALFVTDTVVPVVLKDELHKKLREMRNR